MVDIKMQDKDWTGNKTSAFTCIGARNYAKEERAQHDYYATDPKATPLLLKEVSFAPRIWEPACGDGAISKPLLTAGYNVRSTELYYHGYGEQEPLDFLACQEKWGGDIITNPPYAQALEFIKKALELVNDGNKVAMFLKIQFLESKSRRSFFEQHPPFVIYVSSSRLHCAMNGDFDKYGKCNAICYAWYVWVKGWHGDTVIKWIN